MDFRCPPQHPFWDFVRDHPLLAFGDAVLIWLGWCVTMVVVIRAVERMSRDRQWWRRP